MYPIYNQNPFYNQNQFPNQYQTQMPAFGLNGRNVVDFNEIGANDVPMDGNIAVFPKKDLSEICIKQWTPNGSIATHVYSLVQGIKEPMDINAHIKDIEAKIGDLTGRIDTLESGKKREAKS